MAAMKILQKPQKKLFRKMYASMKEIILFHLNTMLFECSIFMGACFRANSVHRKSDVRRCTKSNYGKETACSPQHTSD